VSNFCQFQPISAYFCLLIDCSLAAHDHLLARCFLASLLFALCHFTFGPICTCHLLRVCLSVCLSVSLEHEDSLEWRNAGQKLCL